uniref:Uncharacterized protein n=1 Tax=Triticum urartu TaxID=4572 RepID=A0A8R7UJM5_TRIUA
MLAVLSWNSQSSTFCVDCRPATDRARCIRSWSDGGPAVLRCGPACLAPSPSGRAGRPAPRPPPRPRANAPVRSAATLPRCRTRTLHAMPQTTASALRRAPVPDRPSARPPARGRCSAAPRSRAQPRPRARLSCTRAAAPWLRARGARRTRRRQRGPEQPRGEVLRPHHGRHRPPRQDLSTGQQDEVVIIKDDDEAAALPSPTPAVVEAEASDVVVDADTVGPSRLPSPTPAASWSSPSRWRVRSRAA